MDGITEKELEQRCARLFSRIGWDVEAPSAPFSLMIGTIDAAEVGKIDLASRRRMSFRSADEGRFSLLISPDLVLKHKGTVEGIVEIARRDMIDDAEKLYKFRKASHSVFVIITNGYIFDLYSHGRYCGRLSAPLSPEVTFAVLSEIGKGEEA